MCDFLYLSDHSSPFSFYLSDFLHLSLILHCHPLLSHISQFPLLYLHVSSLPPSFPTSLHSPINEHFTTFFHISTIFSILNLSSRILHTFSLYPSVFSAAGIVRKKQWCEMVPCLEDEGCDLLVNKSGWTCTQPGGRVKTTTVSSTSLLALRAPHNTHKPIGLRRQVRTCCINSEVTGLLLKVQKIKHIHRKIAVVESRSWIKQVNYGFMNSGWESNKLLDASRFSRKWFSTQAPPKKVLNYCSFSEAVVN